jgi:hypothetical protein
MNRYFTTPTFFRIPKCTVSLAILCILAVTAIAWKRPFLGWDMLPYVAIVHAWTDAAPVDIHAAAYADAARFASDHHLEAVMRLLGQGPYRETMATDAGAFSEQLPLYEIRPLYLLIVAAVSKFTQTVSEATVLVSVLSYCACCMTILWYGVRSVGAVSGSIAGALFALSPMAIGAAKLSTPDALLTMLVTVAAILFVRGRLLMAAALFTMGVLVRTDLELFDLCLAMSWLLFAWAQSGVVLVSGILAASVLVGAAVNSWAGNYGYVVLYRFTFIEGSVPHPASLRGLGIPAATFVKNIVLGVRNSLDNGGLWILLALPGLCLALSRRGAPGTLMCRALLAAVAAYTCARFILFPEHDVRLAAPAAAILTIVLLTIGANRSSLGEATAHPDVS